MTKDKKTLGQDPVRPQHTKNAFATLARTATSETAPETPAQTPDPKPAKTPKRPSQPQPEKPAPSPAPAPAAHTTAAKAVAVNLYLEVDLISQIRAHKARTRRSYANILLDAVENAYPHLDDLLENVVSRREVASGVTLFGRPEQTTVRRDGVEKAEFQVRLPAQHVAVIDELVQKHSAPSRSALLSTALRYHVTKE